MPATHACPDLSRYQDLLLGRVEAAENDSLLVHLERCDGCARRVATLSAADTLLEAVGDVGTLSEGPEPQMVERLIERLLPWKGPSPDGTAAADAATLPPILGAQPTVPEDKFDFLAPPQQPGELGRLGPYRVLGVLGSGGMGVVFLAEDPQLQRRVALKAMLPSLAASTSATQRFLREARAAAAIEHDHIVSIYQVGEDRSVPYLAMQLLAGESLDERLQREGRLSAAEAARIGRQIATGLAAAHARGLMHRDIKPANIFLQDEEKAEDKSECRISNVEGGNSGTSSFVIRHSPFPKVKILDFGLARGVAENSQLTGACMVGTPAYMAPEQTGGQTLDHRCDLFSLGCVLYRMTTGEAPFKGMTPLETAIAVTQHQPPAPRTLRPDLPPAFSDFIMRLLEKKPEDRPQRGRDVAAELARFEENAECRGSTVEGIAATEPRTLTSRRRVRWLVPVAAALLLAATAWWLAPMVYRIAMNEGELVVTVSDPKIEVLLKAEGVLVRNTATGDKYVVVLGEQDLAAGTYEIEVTDEDRGLTFSTRKFSIGRGGWEQVSISLAVPQDTIATPVSGSAWPADAPPLANAPFDSERAQRHQQAWAKYLGVPVEFVNGIGMRFRLIPPGEFVMGSAAEDMADALRLAGADEIWRDCIRSEGPQHKVALSQPFYLGVSEVSQEQYARIMGTAVAADVATQPVGHVSWTSAVAFCAKLNQRERLPPSVASSDDAGKSSTDGWYRLPTEAEWEFACRAGTTTRFWSGAGDEDLSRVAWYGANSAGHFHTAGELPANPFGLVDVHGNLWEFVEDWYDSAYYSQFAETPAVDPRGPKTPAPWKCIRGGSRFDVAAECRSGARRAAAPLDGRAHFGLRVAVSVDAAHPANTPPVAIAGTSADRRAAEWVLQVGGKVNVVIEGVERPVAKTDELPAGEFHVSGIDLYPLRFQSETRLKKLAGLHELTWLRMFGCQITDAGVQDLTDLPKLKSLDLANNPAVGDSALEHIARELTSVKQLQVFYTQITDAGLVHLADSKELDDLNLGGTAITDAGVAHLCELPALKSLALSETTVTDTGLKHLAAIPRLEILWINNTAVTDAGLEQLKGLTYLRHLHLEETRVTAAGVAELQQALPDVKVSR